MLIARMYPVNPTDLRYQLERSIAELDRALKKGQEADSSFNSPSKGSFLRRLG
jgi:hypothetical protein